MTRYALDGGVLSSGGEVMLDLSPLLSMARKRPELDADYDLVLGLGSWTKATKPYIDSGGSSWVLLSGTWYYQAKVGGFDPLYGPGELCLHHPRRTPGGR